ncbi:flagellar basal body rod protein FlgB [Fulvimarina sp. 2208YS6-2-32]|uniref:Flagellar basal body rod protein FlgB n=1 Tax=Fulvimarina uroteuthidis TaxID=3098149 RepID=A0ABU5I0J9_9HYPH|nr:flagellar basal body rod protein FlgB [Fulvimarina sp. 2208YS6-2-32]MDY8108914.1 flagellar basal body rod protein FlgB [Fulvimarina sp. 2208YS6-2-32]
MDQVYLFSLTSKQADWLAHRQALIAENVANVNSPGYSAKELTPFAEVLNNTALAQRSSNPMHMVGYGGATAETEATQAATWDVKHSGNTVVVEQEMMKAGEVARDYSLNTSVVKSFHRMVMMTLRG